VTKLKAEDISFFNPKVEAKDNIYTLGRYTIYNNVIEFKDRVNNIVRLYSELEVRKVVPSYLRGVALK